MELAVTLGGVHTHTHTLIFNEKINVKNSK